MKFTNKALIIFSAWAIVNFHAIAFETPSHWRLSEQSFVISDLNSLRLTSQLGIQKIIQREQFKATQVDRDADLQRVRVSCDPRARMTLPQLLSCGAMYEDIPGVRSFSHFHDPAHNAPLTVGIVKPGFVIPPFNANLVSADWALQDNNDVQDQKFSYRRARQYFFSALTAQGPEKLPKGRNDHWALLFQSLGHRSTHEMTPMPTGSRVCLDQFPLVSCDTLAGSRNTRELVAYRK
jgi:hypothetical protein